MKVSKLIEKLEELKELHGDLEVRIHNREYNCLELPMPKYRDGRTFKVGGVPVYPAIFL